MVRRAGIILAGGSGSRMQPITNKVNKHLLPVYDRPVISSALDVMRAWHVEHTVIVCNETDKAAFEDVGTWLGFTDLKITASVQVSPDGLASAVATARPAFAYEDYDQYVVTVGDGVYVKGLEQLAEIGSYAGPKKSLAWITVQPHKQPQDFGVVTTDARGAVTDIVEKPSSPSSSLVSTGLYAFDPSLFSRISTLTYSSRGELEITDLLKTYLYEKQLHAISLTDDVLWFDVGTPDRLLDASLARRNSLHPQTGWPTKRLEETHA